MDDHLFVAACAVTFCLGAVIASFLNVVAWRAPRGESVVRPRSHCPRCSSLISWYRNIPVLSYLALRGRCADCGEPISPRYILVEILGGALFLAFFLRIYGAGLPLPAALAYLIAGWVWISLMICGSLIDFDHKLLPDFVTVGGMVLGVLLSAVITSYNFIGAGDDCGLFVKMTPLLFSLAGLAFGFGLLGLVRILGSWVFKREAMGMGDVFLMGAVGAMFGPVSVIFTIVLSSVFGSVAGLSLVALSKTRFGRYLEIPYGPYICLGCLVWMFRGPETVRAYMGLVMP